MVTICYLCRKFEVMADIKAEYLACPIRQVVSRFGDKWSMLVLYMLHTSETGVLRFNEIRRLMTGSRVTLFIVRSIRRFLPEWSIP